MYEKVLATIATITVVAGTIWFVCRRRADGRAGNGTGPDAGRIREDIGSAAEDNKQLADAEQRTRAAIDSARETSRRTTELIREAGEDLERGQALLGKARSILNSAKHID